MMQPTYGGLDPTTSPDDFILGAIGTDVNVMITQRAKQDDIVYQKNQARHKRYAYTCTITSSILAICDLYNEEITDDELNKICEEAIAQGLDPLKGWSFYQAVDCARRYWNRTRPDKAVVSFKIPYGTREYFTALSYGYSLVCGYQGNKAYNDDRELDGVVGGKTFPNPTYGHCIRKIQNGGIKVIDNYVGVVRYNIYLLENPKELQENGVYYPSHYVFLREKDMTQSQIDRLEGKKKGLWNGDGENDLATRNECVAMVVRARNIGTATDPNAVKLSEASVGIKLGIWDGTRPHDKATRYEAGEMIKRALGKGVIMTQALNLITRGEMIELIVRTLRQK